MPDRLEQFPLFPLGLVLLPGEVVPLHIFEERYKLMIGECLENDTGFGILWLSDDGLKDIGCTARITRLLRRIEDLPYPAGDVELLADGDEQGADGAEAARERYAELVERVTDDRPDTGDLADLDAYGMAATLDFELDAKQDLLELRSEGTRLERLAELFTATLAGIDHAEVAAERARGNGRMGH
jgi:Lon protease-like protein